MLPEQPILGTRGMVASAHYLATQAGVSILQQGEKAVDAVIAANVVMTVVYPAMCSAGGDLFMLIWEAESQRLHALNASGGAPAAMTPEYFISRAIEQIPQVGPLTISVPGAVDGWFEALERFGSLTAAAIFAPAIAFAEEGFPVSPKLAGWLMRAAEDVLSPWESSAGVYLAGPCKVERLCARPTSRVLTRCLPGRGARPCARLVVDLLWAEKLLS